MKAKALALKLKERQEDFEFYPTTDEIIRIVANKIDDYATVLDCGAGDGRVLMKLTNGNKYAIEKSKTLIEQMPPDIFIIGSDFWEQTLIDKKVDVVFCNPPYSEFESWAVKIVSETMAGQVFLVLPERWKDSEQIKQAIKEREGTATVIGHTSFKDADRPARAVVDVISIALDNFNRRYARNHEASTDSFKAWVRKEFGFQEKPEENEKEKFEQKLNELVPGRGLVPALVEMYKQEMIKLRDNYKSLSSLDPDLFKELDISFDSLCEFLKKRIEGLKNKYWKELFDKFEPVTSRLTVKSRNTMLDTLLAHTSVDFTESNIYAVAIWVIKNANMYFDKQLIDTFLRLANNANLVRYKSNQKTWATDGWRFREALKDEEITHFGLDYRCIISCYYAITTSDYDKWDYPNGLHKNVHNLLNDILVVAKNLGFVCPSRLDSYHYEWASGKTVDFRMGDKILMSVKAYKNGNVHFKFNKKFLRRLNVEVGRLKGWLRSPEDAMKEMDITEEEARQAFNSNLQLSNTKLLTGE